MGDQSIKNGSYELSITDVTQNLPPRLQMPKKRILVKLIDLDLEEANAQLMNQAGAKPGKKR